MEYKGLMKLQTKVCKLVFSVIASVVSEMIVYPIQPQSIQLKRSVSIFCRKLL